MTTRETVAQSVVNAALEGVRRRAGVSYTQSTARWYGIDHHVLGPDQPVSADCSAYWTWCAWQARVRHRGSAGEDILNGQGWKAGYTGTLVQHGHRHRLGPTFWYAGRTAVFYGDQGGGVPEHVAIYVGKLNGNHCVVSHGSEAGPLLLPVFYRNDFNHARAYAL